MGGLFGLGVSPQLLAQPASSCPIPINRQIDSIRAFSKMMPVFRHARCQNCHGGMDPMSAAHPGAGQVEAMPGDFQAFNEQCQACHDELPGWRQPGDPMFFVGKSDEELCLQMKRFEPTGAEFVEHIRIDHGPDNVQFIAAAFEGDRALGEGINDYDGLTIERPPGTQAQLTDLARKWTEILGDGYERSKECGCVVKLKGKFTYTDTGELGPMHNVTKVTGNLDWTPERREPPSASTFGDTGSSFFRPSGGEITVESNFENRGWEGKSSCTGAGRKSFPFDSLTSGALRHMVLEIADDGRYKLTLVIPDTPDPFPRWEFDSECAWPNVTSRQKVQVHSVSVVLGRQQGTIDDEQGIVGRLETPIRRGPRTITGDWSFSTADP